MLPAALCPGVCSASNRNEYQKQKNHVSGERVRFVGLTTLLSSVSRLSRKCGILNISQPYRLPLPVTGLALLFTFLTTKMMTPYFIEFKEEILLQLLCFWYDMVTQLRHLSHLDSRYKSRSQKTTTQASVD
jgi:hypothetical protein